MKKKGFSGDSERMEWMDGLVNDKRTCQRRRVSKQCHTRRHAPTLEFQHRTRDRHVGRYFPARLPSKGRSEGGAPIGVLFNRNGGRRKISPVKVVDDKVFRRWFGFCEAS